MPTARPSISASVEVVEDRPSVLPSVTIPQMPTPTPMMAVSIGIPAARSEPKVMSSTTAETARPMISPEPIVWDGGTASPPISTVRPLSRASSTALVSASCASGLTWVAPTS